MQVQELSSLTRSARGIRTKFWPRSRENALDRRTPNAQMKSSNDMGDGKSFLFGNITSSSTLSNTLLTYSLTLSVVRNSWVPEVRTKQIRYVTTYTWKDHSHSAFVVA